jgi:hypothetical protein
MSFGKLAKVATRLFLFEVNLVQVKNLVAKAIHFNGPRKDNKFVAR